MFSGRGRALNWRAKACPDSWLAEAFLHRVDESVPVFDLRLSVPVGLLGSLKIRTGEFFHEPFDACLRFERAQGPGAVMLCEVVKHVVPFSTDRKSVV